MLRKIITLSIIMSLSFGFWEYFYSTDEILIGEWTSLNPNNGQQGKIYFNKDNSFVEETQNLREKGTWVVNGDTIFLNYEDARLRRKAPPLSIKVENYDKVIIGKAILTRVK